MQSEDKADEQSFFCSGVALVFQLHHHHEYVLMNKKSLQLQLFIEKLSLKRNEKALYTDWFSSSML